MRLFWLVLLSFIFQFGKAQYAPSNLITSSNGLPSNNITYLFMDSRQMLWVGTQQGLAMVQNGIVTSVKLKNNLPILNAWSIVEDSSHNIWVGTYGHGLFHYNGVNWTQFDANSGLATNQIRVLRIHDKKLWIGTSKSVSYIDLTIKNMSEYTIEQVKIDSGIVTSFICRNNSIFYTNLKGETFPLTKKGINKSIKTNGLIHTYTDENSTYYFHKGYFTVHTNDTSFGLKNKETILCNTMIWQVEKVKNKLFAAGWGDYESTGGLYVISKDGCENMNAKFGIDADDIISLAQDSVNNLLFVASKTKGVYQVNLNSSIAKSPLIPDIVDIDSINNSPLYLTKDGVFLTTKQGEIKVDKQDFKYFQVASLRKRKTPLPKRSDGFYELNYNTTAKDIVFYQIRHYKDAYWVNSNIGLFELNKSLDFVNYLPVHNVVFNLDNKGNLVESIPYGGIRIFKNQKESETTVFNDAQPNTPRSITDIKAINDHVFFASVFYGLFVYDGINMVSLDQKGIFNQKNIRYLESIGDSILVASTDFGDLFILEASPPFSVIDSLKSNQLFGNDIQFLASYKKDLFIGMLNGINKYSNHKVSFLNVETGLPQERIITGKVIGSKLWVGTKNGSYSINIKSTNSENPSIGNLKVTALNTNNTPWELATYEWFKLKNSIINLPYSQNTVSIHFQPIGFQYPKLLKYRYRLNTDNHWSNYFSSHEILLPFLSFGEYKVNVEVSDASSGTVTVLPLAEINIITPFFRTWWFYVLILITTVTIVFMIFRQREKYFRKHEEQKSELMRQLEESKMQALLSQMNPHFIFNAINSIQGFILNQDKENALLYLSEFSALIRETLNNSDSNSITLSQEIQYLKRYINIENLRFGNKVKCIWSIDESLDLDDVKIPSMVLQPFIENVFEHAFLNHVGNQNLQIILLETNHDLSIIIKDNGCGFRIESFDKKPHGMDLARKRIALLNSNSPCDLVINSELGKGTKVTLLFTK